jgi:hypothetical protein
MLYQQTSAHHERFIIHAFKHILFQNKNNILGYKPMWLEK